MKKGSIFILTSLFVFYNLAGLKGDWPPQPERGSSGWGMDDERGAIQRITPEKTLEAIKEIKKGRIYSLGREYDEDIPFVSGRSYSLIIPHSAPALGKNRITSFEEFVSTHLGQVSTQLDGMGHVGIGNKLYNGFDRREIATPKGLSKLGIENVGVFLTRGLLLDIAKLKGKERLDKGVEVTEDDLKGALKKQKLEIRPGDAVLIHTGWGSLWKVNNELYSIGEPGIGISAAEFLIEKKIALVGSDNWGVEVHPGADPQIQYPVHQILIPLNGVYILENLDTSRLARDGVYTFAFFFAPLKLTGATGSPGNPVAID